jgi:hypothetical protein
MSLSDVNTRAPDVAHHAEDAATAVAGNAWVGRFVRFGCVVRGTLYLLIGMLALRLSLGTSGEAMTLSGAISLIGHQPFGHVLLIGVSVGLAGYSLWGLIRAVLDPLHEGHSFAAIMSRLGSAGSALAFAGLLLVTLQLIMGPLPHIPASRDWTTELLAKSLGVWLVGIIGLCAIAGSVLGEIVPGWRGRFARDLDLGRRSPAERRWAMWLGRVGMVTRGIVFTIIGVFMVATAFHANPHHVAGTNGALLGLLRQPFGRTLLATAGLGLMAFGAFSLMGARWMRMTVRGSRNTPGD